MVRRRNSLKLFGYTSNTYKKNIYDNPWIYQERKGTFGWPKISYLEISACIYHLPLLFIDNCIFIHNFLRLFIQSRRHLEGSISRDIIIYWIKSSRSLIVRITVYVTFYSK